MKTTLTLAMAACVAAPAFAATRTQGETFTYDDIVQSRKMNVDVSTYQNLRERKARLDEKKRILQEHKRLFLEEQQIQREEDRILNRREPIFLREEGAIRPGKTNSFDLEIAGVYNMANSDLVEGFDTKINTRGVDFTGVYRTTENHAITLRLGVAYGEESKSLLSVVRYKVKLLSWTVMPGYRYTWRANDTLSIYAGVNAGVGQMRADIDCSLLNYCEERHETGFAYSAEIGLKCDLSERVSLLAAYQFGGNLVRIDFPGNVSINGSLYDVSFKTKKQTYNTFRIGLGIRF